MTDNLINKLKKWLRNFLDSLGELLLTFFIAACGYTAVLFFFKMLWALYGETQVGERFYRNNAYLFNIINGVLESNLLFLSLQIVYAAAVVCLIAAFFTQVFFLKRLFYDSRGAIGRMVLFGLPCTAVVTGCMQGPHSGVYFVVCLAPTLSLLGCCFKMADAAVPERLKL